MLRKLCAVGLLILTSSQDDIIQVGARARASVCVAREAFGVWRCVVRGLWCAAC